MTQDTVKHPHQWLIDGKAYDFTNFEHPGGPVALALGQDRDISQLFRSYHPFTDKPEKVLAKYLIRDETTTDIKPQELFDWSKESPFFIELRTEVRKVLDTKNIKCDFWRAVQLVIISVLTFISLPYFIGGSWWALFVCPFFVWLMAVNIMHDASHFALSYNWRINHWACYLFPFITSPFSWYHQHVIGHHVYTNIHRYDPDMHHGTYLWKYSRKSRWYKHYKWQLYYLVLIWINLCLSLSFIIDTMFFLRGSYHKVVKMMSIPKWRKIAHFGGRILTLYLAYLWPYFHLDSLWKAYWFSIIPMFIISLCFSISSQLNHLTENNMDRYDRDWYKHQVLTSHTFCPQSFFWFIFTGGLNLQIEHHLFPGVNHQHLRKIQPIVERVCKKHGVDYNCSATIGEALKKHMKLLTAMSKDEGANERIRLEREARLQSSIAQ
jgi:fatty acid desaturase